MSVIAFEPRTPSTELAADLPPSGIDRAGTLLSPEQQRSQLVIVDVVRAMIALIGPLAENIQGSPGNSRMQSLLTRELIRQASIGVEIHRMLLLVDAETPLVSQLRYALADLDQALKAAIQSLEQHDTSQFHAVSSFQDADQEVLMRLGIARG